MPSSAVRESPRFLAPIPQHASTWQFLLLLFLFSIRCTPICCSLQDHHVSDSQSLNKQPGLLPTCLDCAMHLHEGAHKMRGWWNQSAHAPGLPRLAGNSLNPVGSCL